MIAEILKSLTDESAQGAFEKNKSTEALYKNLKKHTECTKSHDKITRFNCNKDRSICRKCFSK